MQIGKLIEEIRRTPDCQVHPPVGQLLIGDKYRLRDEVGEFYRLCGGVDLYVSSAYTMSIVDPSRVLPANSVIMVGLTPEELQEAMPEESWSWHIIGEGENGEYISIDLSKKRNGYCYDSFCQKHPFDDTPIARSFGELLRRLLHGKGERWYWGEKDFKL